MIKYTVLCNTGVLLQTEEGCLLVDGVCRDAFGFYGLPEAEFSRMRQGSGPYERLLGVVFTHCHPDHFNQGWVELLQKERPQCSNFIPDDKTAQKGRIQIGPFSVSYCETPHMPQDYAQVRHFVLTIEAEGQIAYFAADAVLDAALHESILKEIRPDVFFVNPVYLAVRETRRFLAERRPKRIVVYHIPAESGGVRRKMERTMERYEKELPPVTVVEHYPMNIPEK